MENTKKNKEVSYVKETEIKTKNFLSTSLEVEFSVCCHKCGTKIFGKKNKKQSYELVPVFDIYSKEEPK